jgi:pyrimidine deaminase RibD-like protein
MILNDFTVPKTKYSNEQLDAVLVELCEIILEGKQDNPDFYGSVAAAVIDPTGRLVTGLNYVYGNYRVHAERAAIDKYEEEYGELPKNSIIVTTLSPCSDRMDSRYEESCTDLLNSKRIKLAYCGYNDPTQENIQDKFVTIITENSKLKALCKKFADTFLNKNLNENASFNQCYATACKLYDKAAAKNLNPLLLQLAGYKGDGSTANTHWLEIPPRLWQHYVTVVGDMVLDPTAKQFGPDKATKYPRSQLDRDWDQQYQIKPKEVNENFADGKGPGKPGDSQRHSIRKGATMAELEKASHSAGRKGQLARWQLNMRRGHKK